MIDLLMINRKYKGIGVYLSTGNGFKAPLDAIFQSLDSEKYELKGIDFFKEIGHEGWDKFWNRMWDRVLKYPVFLKINFFISRKFVLKIYTLIHWLTAHKEFLNWLEKENPDFILTTHFIGTLLLPNIIKKSGKRIPVFAYNAEVISAHNSNISAGIARYFSPTEEGTEKLVKLGQPSESIIQMPFPINSKFQIKPVSSKEARAKQGLTEMFTILMSFGGDGIGSVSLIESIAEKKLPVQIIAVCGRSKALYEKIDQIRNANSDAVIHLHGFVDNIPELMSCSDLCTGKAGMNAAFEAIYMRKPYLVTAALFNEIATVNYIVKNGFGWDARKPEEQLRIVNDCINEPGFIDKVRNKIAESNIDFNKEKYDMIISDEVKNYKKKMLKDSKALYFDMAGTLCDIPITSENWDQINIDGIQKVIDYLGYSKLLEKNEIENLIKFFVENKRKLRKRAKTTLEEGAIGDQLRTFLNYADKNYPSIKEKRGIDTINDADMKTMDKLFVSPELDITVAFDDVVGILERLSANYDLYLLSNNVSRQLVFDIMDKLGCTHCFKDILVSEDCGYRKPHINFLDYVTSKTKLKPDECVMIGDRLTQDIRLANLHNLKSIYAAMVDHEDNEGADGERYDYIIHDLKELEEIFSPERE